MYIRWLKGLHISVASEVKRRALAKDIVGENMVAEMGAFSFRADGGGEEIREAPYVHVPNLIRKAADVIEEHRRYTLTYSYKIKSHSLFLLDHQLDSRGIVAQYQSKRSG